MKSKKLFAELNGPTPDPYFAQRVLAHVAERKQQKRLFFWKLISGFSVAFGCVLSFYFYNFNSRVDYGRQYFMSPVSKSMVLQLDEIPNDARIAYVSLEIDSGMSFSISNPEFASKKEITLAVESLAGNMRLPFVFKSDVLGKKHIKIKFLDEDFNLVSEDHHYIEFYDNNKKGESI